MNEEDIEELKRLFYSNRLTQYGKRKLIEYYEQRIEELEEYEEYYKEQNEVNAKFIPKSKVEEKIEELKQEGNYKTIENPKGRVYFQLEPCDYKIQVLEELLQEGE